MLGKKDVKSSQSIWWCLLQFTAISSIISGKMGNTSKYIVGILVFLGANWYLGTQLVRQFEDFHYKNGPLSIKTLLDQVPEVIRVKDIDDDGESELIFSRYIRPGIRGISLFKPSNKEDNPDNPGEIEITFPSEDALLVDVYYNKQRKTYVFRFQEQDGETLIVREIDEFGVVGNEMKFEYLVPGFIEPGTEFKGGATFADLELDGKEEVFIITAAGYERSPRGIICFDAASGKRRWAYPCGALFTSIEVKDLNGDQRREIVLSTAAPNNGAEKNGISDAHSYVIVLDSSGKELWKRVTGDWYTAAYSVISDLDHDGRLEIITATECHQAHAKTRGKMFVFDGISGKQKDYYSIPDASFLKPFVWNPGFEKPRIFVGDSCGRLWMFDQYLKPCKPVTDVGPLIVTNALTGQQQGNYVFTLSWKQLTAYDSKLDKKVFQYTFEPPFNTDVVLTSFWFSPAAFKRETGTFDYLLVTPRKLYRISETRSNVFFLVKNLLATDLLFTFIVLLLTDGSLIYFIVKSRSETRTISFIPPGQRLADKNQPHGFIEIVQGITHQLKNPISTTLWTAEKLKRTGDVDIAPLAGSLVEDVDVLKQQTNHLLKLVKVQKPRLQQKSIKSLLEELVEFYRTQKLPEESIDIRLETTCEKDLFFFIDEELFKEAMVNLMENAVEAMPHGGKLTISLLPVFSMIKGSLKKVIIKVMDTGIGMDKEDLSKVFDPFFTRKPKRTGLGLTISKGIIGAHGGRIEIHSPKGEGTNVCITLPVKKPG
jgi:signal transduction histidine kinase